MVNLASLSTECPKSNLSKAFSSPIKCPSVASDDVRISTRCLKLYYCLHQPASVSREVASMISGDDGRETLANRAMKMLSTITAILIV
jgi:hypothetical protein